MNKGVIILLGMLLFASCNEGGVRNMEYHTPEYYFDNTIEVTGELLEAEYISSNIFKCFYTPYGFLGSMRSKEDKMVHLANLNTGEVKVSACSFGRGPEEILIGSPDLALYKNSLYLLDQRTDKIKRVDIEGDTLKTYDLQKLALDQPAFFLELQVVNDSLFVVLAEDFNSVKKIMLVDRDNNVLDCLEYKLLDDERVDQTAYKYNVEMELSPCKSYLFISSRLFGYISKYKIENNKISLLDKKALVEPKYIVKDKSPLIKQDNINLNNVIYVGDNYMYMIANPESQKETNERSAKSRAEGKLMDGIPDNESFVLVFDYNLNLLKKYKVDSNIRHLVLTPENSIVYALDYRENRLKKYTLPGLE